MEKFIKFVKKLGKGFAVVVVLIVVVTFISIQYQEYRDISNMETALECDKTGGELMADLTSEDSFNHHYFILFSSPDSRSTEDYYKAAVKMISDTNLDPENLKTFHEFSDIYVVTRTNKYIHLFDQKSLTKYEFKEKQKKLSIQKEYVDELVLGNIFNDIKGLPSYSFNRETLENTFWWDARKPKDALKYPCRTIDPSIVFEMVRQSEAAATSGVKKI